jgi:amidase/aspartyl-tRNA(Asn)/glutamyl-tRNA(Gln) amidotransferase subunit A
MELAEEFMIELDGDEAGRVTSDVNSYLESLDLVDTIPVGQSEGAWENRSWSDPVSNPDNAIAVSCSVPGDRDDSLELSGVSVGVKDIIMVAGVPMQCSSALMRGFIPGTDATVVKRLLANGADITAMTNADEFAASGRGTTNYTGPIRNPHDPERVAGGSSGGSGVAVANEIVDVALGTDTGGSIRIPAGLCGVVGLKPTYGLVPLSGVVENTYTQDHVGPLTRSVRDAGRVLEAIAGKYRHDPASLQAAGRDEYQVGGYVDAVDAPPSAEDVRIGVLEDGLEGDTTAQVAA